MENYSKAAKGTAWGIIMNKILYSTGALIGKPNNRDYKLLKPLSENLSCDGFEFMMYNSWYDETDNIAEYLQSIEAVIPVMHCEKHIGEALSKRVILILVLSFHLYIKYNIMVHLQ